MLVKAVCAVRTELQAGEALDVAVAFVAAEYGLNPALLARKVAESHGAMCEIPVATPEPARRTRTTTARQRPKLCSDASLNRDLRKLMRLLGA